MADSLGHSPHGRHLRSPEPMANADLRKAENDGRAQIGRVIQRIVKLRGWSLKEFSGAVGRDERQCARWMDGTERPQFDRVVAEKTLLRVLVIAFAELAGVDVETVIRVRQL